ncbi:unnamed protein product [Nippostrongylus brasiliensis]|uniref:Hva1_TUDOR domain-containing protein n=1 Tax=Nippostrongylus brasiliensis TaxID=27835 RepID=A0A0N4XTH0_NIPBR|nr:unnamed protein product [Nippostrongylus brasiliensis]
MDGEPLTPEAKDSFEYTRTYVQSSQSNSCSNLGIKEMTVGGDMVNTTEEGSNKISVDGVKTSEVTVGGDVVNTTEEGSNKISVKFRDSRPVSGDSWTKWSKGDRGKSEDNIYGSAGSN